MSVKEEIDSKRALLKPSEVLPGKYPTWFNSKKAQKELHHHSWADHWGRTTIQGDLYLVCEPYNFAATDAASVMEFAHRHYLKWRIDSNSWHYPGWTIRILFYPEDKEEF